MAQGPRGEDKGDLAQQRQSRQQQRSLHRAHCRAWDGQPRDFWLQVELTITFLPCTYSGLDAYADLQAELLLPLIQENSGKKDRTTPILSAQECYACNTCAKPLGHKSAMWPHRRICDARKALYASNISLTDDVHASATSAPAQRLVSQLKRLEVSGTAGNLVEPAPEVGLCLVTCSCLECLYPTAKVCSIHRAGIATLCRG
jgi:hypothetical protein